jgi:hypothetical protein
MNWTDVAGAFAAFVVLNCAIRAASAWAVKGKSVMRHQVDATGIDEARIRAIVLETVRDAERRGARYR